MAMEPVLFALIAFLAVIMFAVYFMQGTALDPVQARLQQIAARPRTLEELELQRPLADRTIKPIIQGISRLIARFYPANTVRSIGLKLKRAGMESTSTEFFLGVKGFVAVVVGVLASALVNLSTGDPLITVGALFGGIFLGFYMPDYYLTSKAGGRGSGILNQLPDHWTIKAKIEAANIRFHTAGVV